MLLLGGGSTPLSGWSQSASPPHRQYTANNSLPTNLTKVALQDASGRLWIGTDNGLVRFNGSEFRAYNSALRLIRSITPDGEGGVWVLQDGTDGVMHVDSAFEGTVYGDERDDLGRLFALYRAPDGTFLGALCRTSCLNRTAT